MKKAERFWEFRQGISTWERQQLRCAVQKLLHDAAGDDPKTQEKFRDLLHAIDDMREAY